MMNQISTAPHLLQVTSRAIPPRENIDDTNDDDGNGHDDCDDQTDTTACHDTCCHAYHGVTDVGTDPNRNRVAYNDLYSTNSCLVSALQDGTISTARDSAKNSTLSTSDTRDGTWKTKSHTPYFSFFACLSASFGSLSMGITLACLNTCIEHISRDIDWCISATNCTHTPWHKLLIHIAVFAGLLLGSMSVASALKYGRRFSLMLYAGFHIITALTCSIANSYVTLLWGRFLAGISIGGLVVSVTLYISEISPPKWRGAFSSLNQIMITFGEVIVVSIGNALHRLGDGNEVLHPSDRFLWRVMVGLSAVPSIILIFIFTWIFTFETPHFYSRQKDTRSASRVLQLINHPDQLHDAEQAMVKAMQRADEAEAKGSSLLSIIANPQYRYILLCGAIVSLLHQVTGINVYIASSNRILSESGLTGQNPTLVTTLMMLTHFIFTLPAFWLIERLGRRQLLLHGLFAMTLSVTPAVFGLWLYPTSSITVSLIIAGTISFMIFFSSSYGPVVWCFIGEIFPIEIRNSGTSTCAAIHWISALVVVAISQVLSHRNSFTLFWLMGIIAFVLIHFLVLETKGSSDTPYIKSKRHAIEDKSNDQSSTLQVVASSPSSS